MHAQLRNCGLLAGSRRLRPRRRCIARSDVITARTLPFACHGRGQLGIADALPTAVIREERDDDASALGCHTLRRRPPVDSRRRRREKSV